MDDEDAIAKPDELLALSAVAAELFETLRRWFDVPPRVSLDLSEVDSAVAELGDPVLVAAMAMRKLQALHLLATPGVRTTTDVVVAIVQDLQRALIQAPTMRLKLAAAATDWDAELASLDHPAGSARSAPAAADEADPDADRFRALHARVNLAMEATIAASEGRIRTLL